MSTEITPGMHNHPPRCCCPLLQGTDAEYRICPACPAPGHGELAQGVECPKCHQTAGRPHTEYCPLQLPDDPWATPRPPAELEVTDPPGYPVVCRKCFGYGQVDGTPCPVCVLPACTSPHTNHGDGRGCETDDCPRHGGR